MEWNVPSACAPTVHARTNYWIGTEQKILFLCVSVSVSGDSLSLCSPRCWLHVTCAIWTKDFFFFLSGFTWNPFQQGQTDLVVLLLATISKRAPCKASAYTSTSQPVPVPVLFCPWIISSLSLLFDSRMIRHLVNNKVIYKYKLSLHPADMYFV
jgi:hypothetical protein